MAINTATAVPTIPSAAFIRLNVMRSPRPLNNNFRPATAASGRLLPRDAEVSLDAAGGPRSDDAPVVRPEIVDRAVNHVRHRLPFCVLTFGLDVQTPVSRVHT